MISVVAALLLPTVGMARAEDSAREKWLEALDPKSSAWSRENLLHEVMGDTKLATREQAIALLGEPNYSADLYYPGSGLTNRIDEYRLAAENTQTLRLDSDPSGQIKGASIEGESCTCPLCRRAQRPLKQR